MKLKLPTFVRTTTVERIVAPLSRITKRLQAHQSHHHAESLTKTEGAAVLLSQAQQHREEAGRAQVTRQKIEGLFS